MYIKYTYYNILKKKNMSMYVYRSREKTVKKMDNVNESLVGTCYLNKTKIC